MKKGFGVFAVLALLIIAVFFFILPEKAQAASTDDLTFELNSTRDGYIVSGCNESASGELVIPDTYNGLPITKIDEDAFYGCSNLTDVTIGNNIHLIDDYAFEGCTNLRNITFGESVEYINACAFRGCVSLTSITIPDNVMRIEDYAFGDCTNLASVTIGKGVTYIGEKPFANCSNLVSLQVMSGNSKYHSYKNCIIDTKNKCLITGCKTSQIPSDGSVIYIGDYAFAYCDGLASITIPSSVVSIWDYAFVNCDGLTSITIPNSVTSIGDYAFAYCDGLTSITIPNSVTRIDDYAFSHCTNLTNVTLGKGVKSIGAYAFNWCTSLTNITMSNSITNIGNCAFVNCALTSITIPASVTSIGIGAFSWCNSLKDVYITDPGAWCKINFADNSNSNPMGVADCLHILDAQGNEVSELILPESVTDIPALRFSQCKNITAVVIPDTVKSIGATAFLKCSNLTNITIPDSVTAIGSRAFYECNRLTKVIYCGTQEQWDAIEKESYNENLIGSTLQLHNYANHVCTICGKTECEALGHDWIAADCETPKTCNRCQVTEGNALGHNMQETPGVAPTCETAGRTAILTCANGCGKIEGGEKIPAKGHEAGTAATCETPQTCIHCNYIFAAALGHDWIAADCETPKTCNRCQATEEAPGHKYENGICSVCQNYAVYISVSNSALYRGDTVMVTVRTPAIEHCVIGGFLFDFDTSIFEYVSGEALVSGYNGAGVSTANGQVAGYFMSGEETVQGEVFQITLRVKDKAAFTDYTISGIVNFTVNVDGVAEKIACEVSGATVTIACRHSYGEWIPIDEVWHKHICTICSYEETAYVEYTVTFRYADGTVLSSEVYCYGDTVVVPDAPPAQAANQKFIGWDREITTCTGDATYTAVFEEYAPGDINGDKTVDHNDAIYLLLHTMFGQTNYPLVGADADIDGNGTVNQEDAVYLLLHTLFGEAFYPLT